GLSGVGNERNVQVGGVFPDRRPLLDLLLPRCRGEFSVQCRKQSTRNTADACTVWHQAVGDATAVDELVAEPGVKQKPALEHFRDRTHGTLPRRILGDSILLGASS